MHSFLPVLSGDNRDTSIVFALYTVVSVAITRGALSLRNTTDAQRLAHGFRRLPRRICFLSCFGCMQTRKLTILLPLAMAVSSLATASVLRCATFSRRIVD